MKRLIGALAMSGASLLALEGCNERQPSPEFKAYQAVVDSICPDQIYNDNRMRLRILQSRPPEEVTPQIRREIIDIGRENSGACREKAALINAQSACTNVTEITTDEGNPDLRRWLGELESTTGLEFVCVNGETLDFKKPRL